jgi:UDP-glucose 4-epimerase
MNRYIKHCCVIGGGGFIGHKVVQALLGTGRQVSVIGRSQTPRAPLPHGVSYLCGDIGDRVFLTGALHGVQEIIDLAYASTPKTSYENPVADIISNLPPVVSLFQVASEIPLDKFVVVSSGGVVYGKSDRLPINEDHPTNPMSPYGITKLAAEKYALMYWRTSSLPVVCVRPGNAYGEGQVPFSGQGFIATAITSILQGREILLYGTTGAVRDYIHVEDIAMGIVAALERGTPGSCYNIGTGIGHNNKEVLDILTRYSQKSGKEPLIRVMPSRPFDVPENVLDSTKLLMATGWRAQIGFEEGIDLVWKWFVEKEAKAVLL